MTLVCPDCFGDEGLQKRIIKIRPSHPNCKCDFHPRKKGVPIAAVAEIVDPAFRQKYCLGDYNPHLDQQAGECLEHVIYDFVQVDSDDVARKLVEALVDDEDVFSSGVEGIFYDETQNYISADFGDYSHSQLWSVFRDSISSEQRFFNDQAKSLLEEIFSDIEYQKDHENQSPLTKLSPEEGLRVYRARIANTQTVREKIHGDPHSELGAPPRELRQAGRMNPSGISAFYGAFEIQTCIAELRPAVGSVVTGAEFELNRPIYVLDTTRFETPILPLSPFLETYQKRVGQWRFMQRFMDEIASPVFPDDEHIEYVPTQAVAEYLTRIYRFYRGGEECRIEGIIFQSAQSSAGKKYSLV